MQITDEILELVAKSELTEALKLLKLTPRFKKDQAFQAQLILVEKQHRTAEKQFAMGQVASDSHERKKNQIANSVVNLVQTFQTDERVEPDFIQEYFLRQSDNTNTLSDLGRLLFIASAPKGVGNIPFEREFVNIYTAFQNQHPTIRLKFREDVTADNFARILRKEKPSYLHFAGHCVEAMEGFNPSGIILKDKFGNATVKSFDIVTGAIKLAVKSSPLRLAIFSAGSSDSIAKVVSTMGCYTIGIMGEIQDLTLMDFIENFYHALSESFDDFEHAFACSLNEVIDENKKSFRLFKDGKDISPP